jgi:hypothetical protein
MKKLILMKSIDHSMHKIIFIIFFFLFALSGFGQLGWVQVPSPDASTTRNMVRGISGTSSADVWAVGSYEDPLFVQNDLILHWNGGSWQQFPAMHLSTTLDDLWDVEAISTNNVWAVGMYNDFATTRAELLHYDGVSWTNQVLPFITGGSFLFAMHAVSATDIWAAGLKSGSPTRPAYVIHYNGSSWSEITVPAVGTYRNMFNDIHGNSSNDIWAVGHWTNSYGDFHALAMHWNGSNWTNISLPSSIVSQVSEVLSVKMISSNDVWAMGYYITGGMFKIHWDGSTWTEITPSNGGGGAFAILASNDIYSVGGEISHWDGSAWTIVDQLTQLSYPSLGSTVVFPNGEIWAGGRTVDLSNNFYSLIYRSVNNTPIFSGGGTQSWNVGTNSINNPTGNLLLTTDADVSQILTYTVTTAPTHGTLNGLPATAITNNGIAIPSGVTYTPATGYTGTDQFVLKVSAGPIYSETTINVNVFGVLPVSLIDFQAFRDGKLSILDWSTFSESNSMKFNIEYSTDGVSFSAIGNMPAQGNSNTIHAYRFIHYSPAPGRNYYRLKLVDMDGRTTTYPIRIVQFTDGLLDQFILLSNPVRNGQIDFQANATGLFQLSIINLQGQTLLKKSINNSVAGGRYLIGLPHAIPGIYILKIENSKGQKTFKIVLQ